MQIQELQVDRGDLKNQIKTKINQGYQKFVI